MIEIQDSRCCSPFQGQHSKKLAEISVSLYGIIDNYGKQNKKYLPGGKWCHACKGSSTKKTDGESRMGIKNEGTSNFALPF